MPEYPSIDEIRSAAQRIKQYVHRTPVLTSITINRLCHADVYFKCENLQKTGAFKARGAVNAVFSLKPEEAEKGVATHSSGNHAGALAYAAYCRGINSYVVMPKEAPEVKKKAAADYGARITYCGIDEQDRENTLRAVVERTGSTFIHPYNNSRIIAGQATAALEFLEQVPELDIIITPVGGGGLLSGTALTAAAMELGTGVLGAEPAGADDAYQSMLAGRIIPVINPNTIADGLKTSLGKLTFPIIQQYVSEIITVDDDLIINSMRLIMERMKIVVEPSAVLPLAVLLARPADFKGRKVGLIISGGNVNLDNLPWKN